MTTDTIEDASRYSVKEDVSTHPIFRERDPRRVREIIRRGDWTKPTKGIALGYAQANLAILPRSEAFEFLVFCQRNPKPCPVMEVTEVGDPEPRLTAPGADLRTDLPRYYVFEHGELTAEVTDIRSYWRDDMIGFLLGCGATFDAAFLAHGLPVRQIEERRGPTMYLTNIPCRPAGKFRGPVVVSMRPMTPQQAVRAVQLTSRYAWSHGAPIHIGDPAAIGIKDIEKPDWGVPVTIKPGEVPVFWACGATPQTVALEAGVEIMITHAGGHQFITDLKDEELTVI